MAEPAQADMKLQSTVPEKEELAISENQQEDEVREGTTLSRKERSSYRILGTFAPERDDEDEEEEEDPMAWADLEAFGGKRKTLEKKKQKRKLTPEEVKQQLEELREIDTKMAELTKEKRTKKGMIDTIAWLKKHSEVENAENQQKPKHSSSFVRSVLDFFTGGRSRHNSRNLDEQSGNNQLDDDEAEDFPKLQAPWGKTALACEWSAFGFQLLNQPVLEDIVRIREVIKSDELSDASAQAIVSLAKWLQLFDQHVAHVTKLKEYLLEERTVLAGVGYKVTTLYDLYKEAHANALSKLHGDDRKALGDAILHMFDELEAILKDESLAVEDVIKQTLTEEQEYVAISSLFHHLDEEEECGVIVSKLLGWMKNNFSDEDVKAFLALFDHNVQEKIAGEWMRHYASYLQLLDHFPVNYNTSLTFFQ